ncbi:hypothetical protein C7M84_006566 [Penaeus vannamei]|uniref:Uncharacterized protein n=1 Tax=Penaeus vannamei TaxID=6689 RepID=A0A423TEP4_PENVA|nr:hypothetical protein C7M84_006566 [Penaeus vannamei]
MLLQASQKPSPPPPSCPQAVLAVQRRRAVAVGRVLHLHSDCDDLGGGLSHLTDTGCWAWASDRVRGPRETAPDHQPRVQKQLFGFSSLSSQCNAMACIVWEDFLKERPYFQAFSDRSATNVVKILSAIMGMVGIGMAFVVGNLGTINHVIYAIDGAIGGPLCGLFFIGIFAPWGAFVGLFLSFVFNLWIGLGRFVVGGKAPVRLPLSVDACADDLLATPTSSFNATFSAILNDTASASLDATEALPQTSSHTIYDLSYCYNGAIGIIMNFLYRRLCSRLGLRLEDNSEKGFAEKERPVSLAIHCLEQGLRPPLLTPLWKTQHPSPAVLTAIASYSFNKFINH